MLHEVKITSPPSKTAVDFEELKEYLVAEGFTTDDRLIRVLLKSAIKRAENFLGRALITQTRQGYWENYDYKIYLPYPPIQSVTTVKTILLDDSNTLTSGSEYYVQGNHDKFLRITNVSNVNILPPTDPLKASRDLEVTYVCGYGDTPSDVPEDIREAIMVMVEDSYDYRGERSRDDNKGVEAFTIPKIAKQLLMPYKVNHF